MILWRDPGRLRLSQGANTLPCQMPTQCFFFITVVPIIKLFAWGEGDSGGHALRETTSRGLCGLVCPSRTSERGADGDCVKGGGGEGERERVVVTGPFINFLLHNHSINIK